MMSKKIISVFIPTFNGKEYINELLSAVLAQKLPDDYSLEILVTDSGSTDGTIESILAFGNDIIFDQIPNNEFGHGKTRQRAAEKAKGKYIAFLSQDATPYNQYWLINLLEPFFASDLVGCVYGRQIPRKNAVPTIKREVSTVFGNLGPSGNVIIQKNGSLVRGEVDKETNNFFSDVNSAVRKDLILKIPFRDVAYAEDQALAQDMQRQGYLKAYSPDGAVWHSNEYTAKEFFHRKFDEYLGLINSTEYTIVPSKRELLTGWLKPSIKDMLFTIRDREYPWRLKVKYLMLIPVYNSSVLRGKYAAAKYKNSAAHQQRLSLESKRKSR